MVNICSVYKQLVHTTNTHGSIDCSMSASKMKSREEKDFGTDAPMICSLSLAILLIKHIFESDCIKPKALESLIFKLAISLKTL